MGRTIGMIAGMVFGIAFVINCGTNGNPMSVVSAMMDGGSDRFMIDGIAAAQADVSTVLTGMCDKIATHTQTNSNNTFTISNYYADFAVSVDPATAPHITAVACDYEILGTPPSACASGSTCSDTGYELPTARCMQLNPQIAAGHVIVTCGSESKITYSATPANNSDNGGTYRTIYLRVN